MDIIVNDDRSLNLINVEQTQNENEVTTIELQVPEKYKNYNKKIVFLLPIEENNVVWDIVENNKYVVNKALTQYEKIEFYIWLTHENKDFRTETQELYFYNNVDASGQITPEQISGVNTVVRILDEKIVKVNELELEVLSKIQQVENLDVTGTRVEDGVEITFTDKDGNITTKKVNDGQKGENGKSGVEVGTTEPEDPNVNVWIDDDGTPDTFKANEVIFNDGKDLQYKLDNKEIGGGTDLGLTLEDGIILCEFEEGL